MAYKKKCIVGILYSSGVLCAIDIEFPAMKQYTYVI